MKKIILIMIVMIITCLMSCIVSAYDISEIAKIQASDKKAGAMFGFFVSISSDGNTAIVGAGLDNSKGDYAGAAYIFRKDGANWTEQAKITASDAEAHDRFGSDVSISSDGNSVIVGAYGEDDGGSSAGAAYIFRWNGTNWTQQAKILAGDNESGDLFGGSVSISSDGNTTIIGAYYEDTGGSKAGAAYIFKWNGTNWTQQAKIMAGDNETDDKFGYSVSISSDGETAIVGAHEEDSGGSNAGTAYIFRWTGTTWTQQSKILASDKQADDKFGISVSISSDGNIAIVGALYEDEGGTSAGAAYIFRWNGTNWTQQSKILAGDKEAGDYFGSSVSISSDGETAIVGAYYEDSGGSNAGAAYLFGWNGTNWTQQAKILASDNETGDYFGYSVSISSDGETAIVGSRGEDVGGSDAGAAYLFKTEAAVPTYTEFEDYGSTTNFSDPEIELTDVSDIILENAHAKVEWSGSGYDVEGLNIDSNMEFSNNYVYVNSAEISTFNRSANITLTGVSYSSTTSFNVLKDGQICNSPDCIKLSASPVKFEVTSFSNYTTNGTGAAIPEFSAVTLTFGLIAVLVGLFIIRKKSNH